MGTGQGWHTVAEDCRIAPLEEDTQPPPEVRGCLYLVSIHKTIRLYNLSRVGESPCNWINEGEIINETFRCEACTVACTKKKWNFAQLFWGHLKGSKETPQNDFQIYRPLNDTWQAVFSLEGDIAGRISTNRFRTITFDWSVLRT